MGKPTGFQEYNRELPAKTAPQERVKTYNEFVGMYSDEKLNQQSALGNRRHTQICLKISAP